MAGKPGKGGRKPLDEKIRFLRQGREACRLLTWGLGFELAK